MGIIARLRVGLALITVLACTIAFVGIQRIVLISSTSADMERGTDLISKATTLLSTIDQAEEAILKEDRAGMREAVSQTMASYEEFHGDLMLWSKEDPESRSQIPILAEKFRSALTVWQAKLVRLHTTSAAPRPAEPTPAPPTPAEEEIAPDAPSAALPAPERPTRIDGVEERRARLAMRTLMSNVILQLEQGVASVRNDAAAGIRLLALLALALVGAAALIARRITFQLSQPLSRIELVLNKAAQGAGYRRSGLNSNDEIGRLGRAVDAMLSRMEFDQDDDPTPEGEIDAVAPDSEPETVEATPAQSLVEAKDEEPLGAPASPESADEAESPGSAEGAS